MAVAAVKKPPPKPSEKAAEPETPPVPAKGKGRWVKILLIVLAIAAIGGGAAWYLHSNSSPDTETPAATAAPAKAGPVKPPKYLPLDNFVVNLQYEDTPQFLQVGLSLRVADETVVDALKLRMPEVRNSILLLLSSRKAADLLTLSGKYKLSTDIVNAVNKIVSDSSAPRAEAADAADNTPGATTEADKAGASTGAAKGSETGMPELLQDAPVMSVLFTSFIVQ